MSASKDNSAAAIGHEPNTANTRGIWATAGGFLVVLVLLSIGVWYTLRAYQRAHPHVPQPTPLPATTGPVAHWADPPGELAAWRRAQAELLDGYGWTDRDAGAVRIPIDRAMELLAERGWPAMLEAQDTPAADADSADEDEDLEEGAP